MTQVTRTACTLDCPDSCSLDVTVDDGVVAKIEGAPGNELTDGFICSKVRRFGDHLYHDTRVRFPQRRVGRKGEAKFERISWAEALDTIASKITEVKGEFGGEAILPLCYGGSNGLLTQDTTDMRLFRRLGASNLRRTVCAAPSTAAATGLSGAMTGVALPDYEHAKLIVLWGVNPSVSGIHLVPIVQRAQKAGAKLVVIDPVKTPLAKKADLHLAPRPGSDVALALAVANALFERGLADISFLDEHCVNVEAFRQRAQRWTLAAARDATGLAEKEIETLITLYAESSPAVIRCGWGVERNRNGGSAVAAILSLPAVAGKFKVRAGGYTMSNSGHWKHDRRLESGTLEEEPATRSINMNHIGRVLEQRQDPVKLLFVYNCNPLATLPHQTKVQAGLERDDLFTVVFDPVMTDTARYADIVLPATTFLEHNDLAKSYGAMILHRTQPVIEPVGESRSNPEVFGDLLTRLDLHQEGEPITASALTEEMLNQDSRELLDANRGLAPQAGTTPIQFVDVFPLTSDQKMNLLPEALDREAPEGLYGFQPDPATEDFPLALLSPASNKTINSTMGQLRNFESVLQLSPKDAEGRGIQGEAGQTVRVFNEYGEVVCRARINEDLAPGVAVLPKGAWMKSSYNAKTANALAPDTLTDLGGGACFNDARVQVELFEE